METGYHSGRATQRSSDYAATWPDLTVLNCGTLTLFPDDVTDQNMVHIKRVWYYFIEWILNSFVWWMLTTQPEQCTHSQNMLNHVNSFIPSTAQTSILNIANFSNSILATNIISSKETVWNKCSNVFSSKLLAQSQLLVEMQIFSEN